jgi:serine/threonine protein kinase
MGELLGTGGFGRVNKAVWRGTEVAVKTMSAAYSPELHSAFIEEVPAAHCEFISPSPTTPGL